MAIGVGDVLRITARMSFLAADVLNVYHYLVDVADAGDDDDWMGNIATILDDAYSLLIGAQTTDLLYEDIIGQNITKDEILPTVSWPTLNAGVEATEGVPPQCCGFVYWSTVTPRVLGRKFLGVFGEGEQIDGIWSAGIVASMLDFAGEIEDSDFATPGDRTATPGVYRVLPERFTALGLSHVVDTVYTQRRRTRGRGS